MNGLVDTSEVMAHVDQEMRRASLAAGVVDPTRDTDDRAFGMFDADEGGDG